MTTFGNIPLEAYERAELQLQKYKERRVDYHKEEWDQYNLSIAWKASTRSPDSQTKVGSYLTTEDHLPISTGYNGFPREARDYLLPNMRPEKYPWMIHSEINAILNAALQGKSTKNSILYCTHRPCFNCSLMLWQAGCKEIIFDKNSKTIMSDNEETDTNLALFDIVIKGKMTCRGIDFGV